MGSGRLGCVPAKAAPAPDGMEAATTAATAAAGAMAVMLWNRTSRNPIASPRSRLSRRFPRHVNPPVHINAPRVAVTRPLRLA